MSRRQSSGLLRTEPRLLRNVALGKEEMRAKVDLERASRR